MAIPKNKLRSHQTRWYHKLAQVLLWIVLVGLIIAGSNLVHKSDEYLSKPDISNKPDGSPTPSIKTMFEALNSPDIKYNNLTFQELKYMKILGIVMIVIGIFGAITLPMTALYSFQDLIYFLTGNSWFWFIIFATLLGFYTYLHFAILLPKVKNTDQLMIPSWITFSIGIVVVIATVIKGIVSLKANISDATGEQEITQLSNKLKQLGAKKIISKGQIREVQDCLRVTDKVKDRLNQITEATNVINASFDLKSKSPKVSSSFSSPSSTSPSSSSSSSSDATVNKAIADNIQKSLRKMNAPGLTSEQKKNQKQISMTQIKEAMNQPSVRNDRQFSAQLRQIAKQIQSS